MENKRVEVKINNVEYTLVTNETEEYVQKVALLVNKKMAQITGVNPQLSTAMTAVLASINLADELIKVDGALDNFRGEVNIYADENKKLKMELDEKKLEVEKLKEDMHKLHYRPLKSISFYLYPINIILIIKNDKNLRKFAGETIIVSWQNVLEIT